MQKILNRVGAVAALSIVALLAISPFASAADIWGIGEVGGPSTIPFWLLTVGVVALLAGMVAGVRAFVKQIPLAGPVLGGPMAALIGVALLIGAAIVAPGGLGATDDTPSAGSFTAYVPPAASAAAGAGEVAFDANLYEPTSSVIVYAADAASPSTAVNPVLSIYARGVSEKAAMEGTATPLYTATLSSGTATFSAVMVQTYGCTYDIGVDASGFYEKVLRDVNLCRAKNANGLNTVSVPTIFMDDLATLSLALSSDSLTCSAGSTCTYSLVISNTEVDSKAYNLAVKFSSATNATLNGVVTGSACELVEVSSTQYIKFNDPLGSLDAKTCSVQITRTAASDDGTWSFTLDDLFQVNAASGWNANSNTRGATATAAITPEFA